jgi:hypothetical protein
MKLLIMHSAITEVLKGCYFCNSFPYKSLRIWPTLTNPHLNQACTAELLSTGNIVLFS